MTTLDEVADEDQVANKDQVANEDETAGTHQTDDAQRQPERQVVTVFAPKGGTGATTLAINLAAALHAADQRVCLVDLDLEFGDVAVSLGLDPVRSVADALAVPLGEDLAGELVTEYRPGFDCVLAPIEPAVADEIPDDLVRGMLDQLRARYDVVVVDAQHRFSDPVLAAIDSSDHLLLVTTPEIASLKSIRITLDVLDLLEHPHSARHLVLQKQGLPSGLTAEEATTALGLDLGGAVPFDEAVTAAANDGTPLGVSDPAHPVSAAIRDHAVRVLLPEVARAESARKRRRLFGRKS